MLKARQHTTFSMIYLLPRASKARKALPGRRGHRDCRARLAKMVYKVHRALKENQALKAPLVKLVSLGPQARKVSPAQTVKMVKPQLLQ